MKNFKFELSSFWLHVFAMIFMLMDHSWASILYRYEWLTCVGRIAFPIFAFMIAEGYHYTKDVKKYIKRMLIWALISEIPFNLLVSGNIIYPFHQNVMFTFVIGLLCFVLIDRIKEKYKPMLAYVLICLVCGLAFVVGFVTFVDYYGSGVLLLLGFHLFRGDKLINKVGQFAIMYYINCVLLAGYYYAIPVFNTVIELPQQAIAMLALVFIWLYKGKQGYHSKGWQFFCYAFYPLHCLVLGLLAKFVF